MSIDPAKLAQAAKKKLPPPRRGRQTWLPYSWAVRVLVENYGARPTDAANQVLKVDGVFEKHPQAEHQSIIDCVRVGYYKIRNEPWPEKTKGKKKS